MEALGLGAGGEESGEGVLGTAASCCGELSGWEGDGGGERVAGAGAGVRALAGDGVEAGAGCGRSLGGEVAVSGSGVGLAAGAAFSTGMVCVSG